MIYDPRRYTFLNLLYCFDTLWSISQKWLYIVYMAKKQQIFHELQGKYLEP